MSENIYSTLDLEKKIGFSRKKIFNILNYLNVEVPKIKYGNTFKSVFNDNHVELINNFIKNNPNTKEIIQKKTLINKYGVDSYSKTDEFRNKFKQTCLEKYGVDSPSKVEEFKEKSKNTCLEKYGVEYSFQSDNNKEKSKQTCLEKYGTEFATQSEEIINKSKQTCLDRYGVNSYSKTDEFKEKSKQTCLEHFGVEYPAQNKEIYNKVKRTCLEKYNGIGYSSEELNNKTVNTMIKKYGVKHNMLNPYIKKKVLSNKGMTSPESKLNYFLQNRGFDYSYEYECNGKNFDFAIFKEGQLSILVEIDGEYFHGLLSDYDGKHVQGQHDCERFRCVPDNVKFIVCDSSNVDKCIEEILRVFTIDYDVWIKEIINSLPNEFPYPSYSNDRLIKDYKHLCEYTYNKNQRLGDSTIRHFHKSIWTAHRSLLPSPYEAWQDKSLLEKCVRNRFIYSNNLSSQNILNGFNVCKIAPRISIFSASLAKYLIDKYLSDYNEIFDPFSGFSGRLLGTCASGKKYIGQDINEEHIKESQEIIDFHNLNAEVKVQDILIDNNNEYQCLFTCPPYGGLEHWNILNDEVEKSCDEWIDVCLEKYKCNKYLFVINETKKYKDYIIEDLTNKSHFGNSKEYVILI